MFHAAKAVLFSIGLREKKHYAITIVLQHLVKEGKLENRYAHDFAGIQYDREQADYHYNHTPATASQALTTAKDFTKRMKTYLKDHRR